MASSHRKPRSTGSRIAGIWTPAADDGTSRLGEVERKVDDLYRQADSATERYNAGKERAPRQRKRVDPRLDDGAERARRINAARERLSSFTAAQYRTGAAAPDTSAFVRADAPLRQEATGSLRPLNDTQGDLKTAKAAVQRKLSTAREVLSRLTPQSAPSDSSYATKAAKAIAFARAQVGKPYVCGATGPDSYDCSGLTKAAWKAAGVTLPRATADQANAGTTVSPADAEPGDLIFFYDDISHVGLYVGDGMMIHAPKPGTYVREESIHHGGTSIVHSVVRPA
ncbi:NlpC/P60 family protein [Streptomyces sp. NPDC088350]|uniref:C40 family peptidase n=1 Tax=Streptomyces sp. NPDC088350 TaxID=3365854 RepID=UPI00382D1F67